ncbi:hypothetical protein EIP91_004932 [Steccherinum ochraceum]|uniref:Uncharacterized protein n=1 Tax=Steccherinum ochraceum TaxID=92696 RepID=A0A4R0R7Z0_9APHY|nr:hypothetical protein EIP91_004932 [Steccherinum ochraceum]
MPYRTDAEEIQKKCPNCNTKPCVYHRRLYHQKTATFSDFLGNTHTVTREEDGKFRCPRCRKKPTNNASKVKDHFNKCLRKSIKPRTSGFLSNDSPQPRSPSSPHQHASHHPSHASHASPLPSNALNASPPPQNASNASHHVASSPTQHGSPQPSSAFIPPNTPVHAPLHAFEDEEAVVPPAPLVPLPDLDPSLLYPHPHAHTVTNFEGVDLLKFNITVDSDLRIVRVQTTVKHYIPVRVDKVQRTATLGFDFKRAFKDAITPVRAAFKLPLSLPKDPLVFHHFF